MDGILLLIYLVIGFVIARSKKDDPSDTSTGLERIAWFLFWPFCYIARFGRWVINTFED